MKLKPYFRFNLSLPGLFILFLLFQVNCSEKSSGHVLSNIDDHTTFKLYIKETHIGTIENSIDRQGNYHRKIHIALAGQQFSMTMDIIPDPFGDWKQIKINNPIFGRIDVERVGNRAEYSIKGQRRKVKLPQGDYTFYDDYGDLFESVMLKKYDMAKKGKQAFQRFRIPESPELGGNILEIELEFLGNRQKTIKGSEKEFLVFNYKILGMNVEYWTDRDFRIVLIHAPVQHVISHREGYAELLPFKTGTTVHSQRQQTLDIPVFLQFGWFDGDGIGAKLSYLRLKESKNKHIKMILGPWGHTDYATTQLAGQEMGEEAGIDLLKLYQRWFDYWLKGIDTKILAEPLVQLYAIISHPRKSLSFGAPASRSEVSLPHLPCFLIKNI
jgi:hypothetical protein